MHKFSRNAHKLLAVVFIMAAATPVSVEALSLELGLNNTFYSFEDRYNTESSRFNYYGAYDLAVQGLGFPGVSVYSNVAVTNAFTDPLRKKFNARTLTLEALDLFKGLDLRAGRQHLYRAEAKSAYLDGVDLTFRGGDLFKINAYGGLNVPSQYSRQIIEEKFKAFSVGGSASVHVLNAVWLGLCGSDNFDSTGSVLRAGARASGRFASMIDLNALALFNITESILEEYDVHVGLRPVPSLRLTAFVLGEQATVDSTNPFMRIIQRPHTDIGLRVRTGLRSASVEAHYVLRNDSAGIDHLAGLDGSVAGIAAGYEFGTGKRGGSHSATLSYARIVLTNWELGATVRGDWNRYADSLAWNNSLFAAAHAAYLLPVWRLRICPEFQFITNKYYSTDYRLLLNAQYTFSGFWKS